MERFGKNTSQIPVCQEVRALLAAMRDVYSPMVDRGDGDAPIRSAHLSIHMLLELLVAYATEKPPSPSWLRAFQFRTRGPGRPKGQKLALKPRPFGAPFPQVSEDKLGGIENEAEEQQRPISGGITGPELRGS